MRGFSSIMETARFKAPGVIKSSALSNKKYLADAQAMPSF